jgi:hypothetical protein
MGMNLHVSRLAENDRAAYARLANEDSDALIYASPDYQDFLAAALGGESHVLGCWMGDRLVGVLPAFVSAPTDLGRVVNSLPWYGSHGGCLVAADVAAAARTALLQAFAELARGDDILSATLVMPLFEQALADEYAVVLAPTLVDGRIGQVTHFPAPGADRADRLMRMFRYPGQVRKSLRQGFEYRVTDDDWAWSFLYDVHVENMQAVGGKAKPWEHFSALRRTLPADCRGLSVAMLDGEPVAALLLLYFNGTVEYFTPVIRHDFRPMQPLSFLIWNGMAEALERGFTRWNWGGTWHTQKSLHHFKSGWGAVDHPYSYLILAGDEGVARMRANRDRLGALFPYFFCYPFDQL